MAEVRRRLLRRSVQLHTVEDVMPSCRAVSCMAPALCNRGIAACASAYSHRKWMLWLSSIHRRQCMLVPGDLPQIATLGARRYHPGPTASFHQTRSYRHGNNGALDSNVPLYTTRSGYYDVLEVSGNATQAQIKTAYYKQSFRFHPDRNAGNEAATRRFGQVTEAYHVLGSTSLRKKYDRGILSLEDVRNAKKPSVKSSSPSRKDASGQRPASSASSSSSIAKPMFDFDAFYQAHYGEQLAREQRWKERREVIERKKREKKKGRDMNKMVELSAFVIFLPAIFLFMSFKK